MDPMKSDQERIVELEEKVELLGQFTLVSIKKHNEMEDALKDVSLLAVKLTERTAALYAEVLRMKGDEAGAEEIERVNDFFKAGTDMLMGDDEPATTPERPDFDLENRPDWFK